MHDRTETGIASSLQHFVDDAITRGVSLTETRRRLVAELERTYVATLLARHHGSVARAAAASGLADRYFRALKARYTARAIERTSTAQPRRS